MGSRFVDDAVDIFCESFTQNATGTKRSGRDSAHGEKLNKELRT